MDEKIIGVRLKNSLSAQAKNEILGQATERDCCELAFLSAVIHTAGSLLIRSGGGIGVIIKSTNPLVKKRLDKTLSRLYGITTIAEGKELSLGGEDAINILTDCGILRQNHELKIVVGIDSYLVSNDCCAAAYVSGAFVGSGSISAAKSGYHLEFAVLSKAVADDLVGLLLGQGIPAKYIARKDRHIVYLKDNEAISDCLTFCGASKTVLSISGMYVDRQVRQQSNRQRNCDLANVNRTVNVGVRQAELFEGYIDHIEDERLLRTARVRIENPEASYDELAAMLGVTKSGIKHRLKKLELLAGGTQQEKKT